MTVFHISCFLIYEEDERIRMAYISYVAHSFVSIGCNDAKNKQSQRP